VSRTVRRKGPDGPRLGDFPKSFDCVFEWITRSCIECRGLECLGQVNGGGWGCIYSPQPLPSRCSISANRGRSAPLVRMVRLYTSMDEIPTVGSNGYINSYYALNVSSDVRYGSRGRSVVHLGWSARTL
jgi:hypothetical protein